MLDIPSRLDAKPTKTVTNMAEKSDISRVGVALIGAGMIAKTHVEALSATRAKTRLEAIVSRHPERAQHLAQHYDGSAPLFTNDITAIANNPDVQVAIVATPPSVRIDLIKSLTDAGKHILLEKPVARTTGEAVQVVEICERAGVTLGIVFQHRMRASSKAAAQLIKSGTLGEPGLVEIAVPLWREQSYYDELDRGTYARDGGGVLITQAIHTIELALSLTGPVTQVQAMTATTNLHSMEAEDFAVAGLRFASGAVGSLVTSTATFPHGREKITLHYQHGSVHVAGDTMDVFWRDGRHEQSALSSTNTGEDGPIISKYESHQAIIEDFIDAVQHDREPIVNGRAALGVHRLIEAIENSSRTGTPISVST